MQNFRKEPPVFKILFLFVFQFLVIGVVMSKNISPNIIFSIPQGWNLRVVSADSVTAYNPEKEGEFLAATQKFDEKPLFNGIDGFLNGVDKGLDIGMPTQLYNYTPQGSKIYNRREQRILLRHFSYEMNEKKYKAIQWIFVISNVYVINFIYSNEESFDESKGLKVLAEAMDSLTMINHRKDFLLALKSYFSRDYKSALIMIEKALITAPEEPEYINYKALCIQKISGVSKMDEMKELFLKSLSIDPGNIIALTNLAGCALYSNEPKKAETYYLAALDKEPMNSIILKSLARLYYTYGNNELAIEVLNRTLEYYPNDSGAQVLLDKIEQ